MEKGFGEGVYDVVVFGKHDEETCLCAHPQFALSVVEEGGDVSVGEVGVARAEVAHAFHLLVKEE